MTVSTRVYAAEEYLAEKGTPETPEDLDQHNLIIFGYDAPHPVPTINWLLDAGVQPGLRAPILRSTTWHLRRCVGLGVAGLPDFMVP